MRNGQSREPRIAEGVTDLKTAKAQAASALMATQRLNRSALLRSTALQAAVGLALAAPALAQPVPNARPMGGQVTAGSASIGTTTSATTITQSTNRAAIDWTSYNIGSQQSVNYQQPSSTSVTLNRVTSSDPSQIAGKINANGQIVITNQSGVTFYQGSEVNAQSVVVSAAGITNQNFMAGKMAFDQAANPNARIVNNGNITVKQAGLAALVAPSVANSGVINAKLGHVILAGAAAHTLDMYGDGLVSIDVTKQVTTVPAGADGKAVTALVTNTGTIRADGGVVQLTASAADGVVQTLVRGGGHIQANTVGNQTGRIEVAGTGGSVVVEGRLAADGRAPGTIGGQVMVAGSNTTTVAASAHISASGQTGGGAVAVGTTLARATGSGPAPAGTSTRTVIASGARVSANATGQGNGGRITVLSTQQTAVNGALAAKGGTTGGNGGEIEMSGEQGFSLTGKADVSAPHGALGTILLDPANLTISSTSPSTITPSGTSPNIAYNTGGTATNAVVSPAQLTALTGNLVLQASQNLTVASNLAYSQGSVTLQAGNNLTVNSGVTLSAGGNLLLYAGWSGIPGYNPAGGLSVQGSISGQGIDLRAGTGGIALGGTLTASTSLELTTSGAVTQSAGSVQTPNIFGTAASVSLTQSGNQIAGLGLTTGVIGSNTTLTMSAGGLAVATSVPLTVGANSAGVTGGVIVPAGQSISLQADTLSLIAGAGQTALSAPGGTVILQPLTAGRGITVTNTPSVTGGVLALSPAQLGLITASALQLGGAASSGNIVFGLPGETTDLASGSTIGAVALSTTGTVTQGGPLLVNGLNGSAGTVTLTNAGNSIPNATGLTASGGLTLSTANGLTLSGAYSSNGLLSISAGTNLSLLSTGSVSAPNGGTLTAGGALSVAGSVTSNRGFSMNAGAGGIAFAGNVSTGQVLTIQSSGPVTQTAGGITVGDLEGSALSVSLPSRTNAIDNVAEFAAFSVTGNTGDFTLVDSVPLTVSSPSSPGGVSVQSGRTISLSSDSLTLQAGGDSQTPYALSASGGTIIISPFTSGYGHAAHQQHQARRRARADHGRTGDDQRRDAATRLARCYGEADRRRHHPGSGGRDHRSRRERWLQHPEPGRARGGYAGRSAGRHDGHRAGRQPGAAVRHGYGQQLHLEPRRVHHDGRRHQPAYQFGADSVRHGQRDERRQSRQHRPFLDGRHRPGQRRPSGQYAADRQAQRQHRDTRQHQRHVTQPWRRPQHERWHQPDWRHDHGLDPDRDRTVRDPPLGQRHRQSRAVDHLRRPHRRQRARAERFRARSPARLRP